jgi:hypothetical protein
MTYNPTDLLAVHNYLRVKTGLPANELGVVGDTSHNSSGGYHVGNDVLSNIGKLSSDYSKRESSRDRPGSNAASAIDIGNFARRRDITAFILAGLLAGDPRLSDVREMIYCLDGVNVRRFDRLGIRSSGDDSHKTHTHISFFRDSEGGRNGMDNFLGFVKEFFEGKVETLDERLLNGWPVPKELGGKDDSRGAGIHAAELWRYMMDGAHVYDSVAGNPDGTDNGMYLDKLLKGIRSDIKKIGSVPLTDAQFATFQDVVRETVRQAVAEALAPLAGALGSAGDSLGKLND